MMLVLFSCTNSAGYYQECSLSGFDLEVCLETLTRLVPEGWRLQSVKLVDADGGSIFLPVAAFDGQSLFHPIQQLQHEWETLLNR